MVWVKICGITSTDDAKAISCMGADTLGFIFSTDSPRRIAIQEAKNIDEATPFLSKTGVFVNEEIGYVKRHMDRLGLGFVQFSGEEDMAYLKEVKKYRPKVKIIKALRVKDSSQDGIRDMEADVKRYLSQADYILLDSYLEGVYGGTGNVIDWDMIKGLIPPDMLIISGGLYHENVGRAMDILKPFGVDASTRLEIKPGKKDHHLTERFIYRVKGYDMSSKDKDNGKEKKQ